MKKKFLLAVLCAIGALCCAVGLSACTEPAHDHSYVQTVVEPTCTEQGYTLYKCNCGEEYKDDYIVALGHAEVTDEAVAATCTTTGLTEGKHCSVCDTVLIKQETIKANGHTEVTDNAVAATCTTTGLTEGKHCSVCNTVLVNICR